MKPRCPSIDLTLQVLCFSLPILRGNIYTHLMFEYEIHIFEPRTGSNFYCKTIDFISAYSVVARKARKAYCPHGNRSFSCCMFQSW